MARWMRVVGWFDRAVDDLPPGAHVGQADPQLTGADGGHDISSRGLARRGVVLLGRLETIRDGTASFADDVATNLAWADDEARRFLGDIDAAIERQGIEAPIEEWPADLRSDPTPPLPGPRSLDLRGVGTLIWATGYRPDFDWVRLPFTDAAGYPIQRRGVTGIPGLYVLGLHWLYKAKSGIFAGIDEDATHLASVIAARVADGDR
jgi:putative flavoprotein involved in K+ transport